MNTNKNTNFLQCWRLRSLLKVKIFKYIPLNMKNLDNTFYGLRLNKFKVFSKRKEWTFHLPFHLYIRLLSWVMVKKAAQFSISFGMLYSMPILFHNIMNTHTHDNVSKNIFKLKRNRGDIFARKTDFSHRFLPSSFILRRYLKTTLIIFE